MSNKSKHKLTKYEYIIFVVLRIICEKIDDVLLRRMYNTDTIFSRDDLVDGKQTNAGVDDWGQLVLRGQLFLTHIRSVYASMQTHRKSKSFIPTV